MSRKILIMGLPGAGKTTLARALAPRINAVNFNNDEIRENINRDLGFSPQDRIEQARRMGWLCDQVLKTGGYAIADFVCPTEAARAAFIAGGDAFVVWVNRIKEGRFADTNKLFEAPKSADLVVLEDGTPEYWAEQIALKIRPIFDPKKPTALFVGRYQPFHEGHRKLIIEGINRVGQACVGVRDTGGTSAKDPFDFEYVKSRIEVGLREFEGRFVVIGLPNVSHILYGRDVGYIVEQVGLDSKTEQISATIVRGRMSAATAVNV